MPDSGIASGWAPAKLGMRHEELYARSEAEFCQWLHERAAKTSAEAARLGRPKKRMVDEAVQPEAPWGKGRSVLDRPEIQEALEEARRAFRSLPQAQNGKCVAIVEDGEPTESGRVDNKSFSGKQDAADRSRIEGMAAWRERNTSLARKPPRTRTSGR